MNTALTEGVYFTLRRIEGSGNVSDIAKHSSVTDHFRLSPDIRIQSGNNWLFNGTINNVSSQGNSP